MRFTFDGLRTFTKIETAATYALDFDVNPKTLKTLVDGQTVVADEHDIRDLQMHMRDQAAPL